LVIRLMSKAARDTEWEGLELPCERAAFRRCHKTLP
jgi:hypothetical protein